MRKSILLPLACLGLFSLTGCESFDRFEAWKKEMLFGEPNPYNVPAYPYQQYPGAPGQPMMVPPGTAVPGAVYPPGTVFAQPGQPLVPQPYIMSPTPFVPGQPVAPGYAPVAPQMQPPPSALLPPSGM